MKKLSALVPHASRVGLFFIGLFVLCLIWGYVILKDPQAIAFHYAGLKALFPGYTGLNAPSLILGAVLSFVYGFVGSLAFHGMHKGCCRNG